MADIEDEKTQQGLRKLIREEVAPILRQEIKPIIRDIIREEVRPIIREETDDMRTDISDIKAVLSQHSIQLRQLSSSVGTTNTTLRSQQGEMARLGVLLEDLDDRFKAAAEVK